MLALNDEAVTALRGATLAGSVRLGMQQDFGEHLLTDVLGRFARAHPQVCIDARVARNVQLLEQITAGQLDLALAWDNGGVTWPHAAALGRLPLRWLAAASQRSGNRPSAAACGHVTPPLSQASARSSWPAVICSSNWTLRATRASMHTWGWARAKRPSTSVSRCSPKSCCMPSRTLPASVAPRSAVTASSLSASKRRA